MSKPPAPFDSLHSEEFLAAWNATVNEVIEQIFATGKAVLEYDDHQIVLDYTDR